MTALRSRLASKPALLASVALAALALAGLARLSNALRPLELSSVDARFSIRGTKPPKGDIVVVGLDAASLAAFGIRPPLPRGYHARMLDRLRAAHPRLIAYDLQFTGRTRPTQDRALIAAVNRARPVLLATHDSPTGPIPVPAAVDNPDRIGAVPASVGVPTDPDGKVRRMLYEPVGLKFFDVRAAELLTGHAVSQAEFPGNAAWINFRGPPGTFPTYSFSDVLAGRTPASTFRDKVVILGITDPIGKDIFQTAASATPMSGAELHANALQTVLDGLPLRPVAGLVDLLALMILAAVPALATLRLPALYMLLAVAGVLALFAVGVQLAFDAGRIVTLSYPVLAIVLSTAGSATVDFLMETRRRRTLEESIDRLMAQVSSGDTIGGYRIEEVAARGGMGVVYRAVQPGLDRPVALKVIAPELASDETFRERFHREALHAASVEHPNVIPVYEAGQDRDLLFLAMRYVDGTDLLHLLRDGGGLEPQRAVEVITQVAAALDAAHGAGLVHRDIKPANVLLEDRGGHDHAFLTDFGLTKRVDSRTALTQTGSFVGTVDYMSPEQLRGTGVDARADIYALGCVLFEVLTGRVPYPRDTDIATMFAHAASPIPSVGELRPELPEAIDGVIARAMAKDARERYASAGELAEAARVALAGASAAPAERTPAPGTADTRSYSE